jgi:DNA-binding ferritin-like protein
MSKKSSKASAVTSRTRIDLGENTRRQMIDLLNARLADALDLAGQCKQAHWNVKGSRARTHKTVCVISGL